MQERLQSLDGPVFDAKAVELCCRKIAATSGDMRKCLNAAYAALENFISQTKIKNFNFIDNRPLNKIRNKDLSW